MSRRLDIENFTAEKLAWHQLISATPGLSLPAKAVAGLLLHDLNPLQGGAWRGQDSMSELLGVSERQLRRVLSELQKAGFLDIEIQKGRGRTKRYFATVPTGIELIRPKASERSENASESRPESGHPWQIKRTWMADYTFIPLKTLERRSGRRLIRRQPPQVFPDIRREELALIGPEKTASYLDSSFTDDFNPARLRRPGATRNLCQLRNDPELDDQVRAFD